MKIELKEVTIKELTAGYQDKRKAYVVYDVPALTLCTEYTNEQSFHEILVQLKPTAIKRLSATYEENMAILQEHGVC